MNSAMPIMTQTIRTLWRSFAERVVSILTPVACWALPDRRMILRLRKLPNGLCMLWRRSISAIGIMYIPVIINITWPDIRRYYPILLISKSISRGMIKSMMGWSIANGPLMLIICVFTHRPMEIICLLFIVRAEMVFPTGSTIHWYLWIMHRCMNFGHWYGDCETMLIRRLISVTTKVHSWISNWLTLRRVCRRQRVPLSMHTKRAWDLIWERLRF